MTTFNDVIESVRMQLQAHAGAQQVMGTVKVGVTATDMTVQTDGPIFNSGSGFRPGIVEIGEELVYVQAVSDTGVFTGVLRGQGGTTPVAHPAGTPVTGRPVFPRNEIKKAINSALRSTYPSIFAVKTTNLALSWGCEYELPGDALDVLAVFSPAGGFSTGRQCEQWEFEPYAATTSGKALWVGDAPMSGTLRVAYMARPGALVNPADDFATATGLPDWLQEVAVLGACVRLTAGVDAGKALGSSAEQKVMNDGQIGRFQTASKYFVALYQQAVTDAQRALQQEHPVRIHSVR